MSVRDEGNTLQYRTPHTQLDRADDPIVGYRGASARGTIWFMNGRSKQVVAACQAVIGWWIFVHFLPVIFDWPMGGQDGNPVPGPPRDTALLLGALMLVPGIALTAFLLIRARAVLIGGLIALGTTILMGIGMYLSDSWCPNIYSNTCHGTTVIQAFIVAPPLLGTVLFGMMFGRRRGLRPSSVSSAVLAVIVVASFVYLPATAASSPVDGDNFLLYYWWPFGTIVFIVLLAIPALLGVALGAIRDRHGRDLARFAGRRIVSSPRRRVLNDVRQRNDSDATGLQVRWNIAFHRNGQSRRAARDALAAEIDIVGTAVFQPSTKQARAVRMPP